MREVSDGEVSWNGANIPISTDEVVAVLVECRFPLERGDILCSEGC